jgi:hypothetical protein
MASTTIIVLVEDLMLGFEPVLLGLAVLTTPAFVKLIGPFPDLILG